jgi:hypothetical protein
LNISGIFLDCIVKCIEGKRNKFLLADRVEAGQFFTSVAFTL